MTPSLPHSLSLPMGRKGRRTVRDKRRDDVNFVQEGE